MSPDGAHAVLERAPGEGGPLDPGANASFFAYLSALAQRYPLARRLTLVHCPTFNFDAFNIAVARNRGYYAYPPTGLQCLKASLAGLGLEVDILDVNYELLKRICRAAPGDRPAPPLELMMQVLEESMASRPASLIGVSAGVIVSNVFGVKDHPFIQTLRYFMERGDSIVLAGGVIATQERKNLLQRGLVHFVFEGEGEEKLRCFLGHFLRLGDVPPTPGIHFRWEGRLRETSGPPAAVRFGGDLVGTYGQVPVEDYHQVGCLSPFSRVIGADRVYATVQLNRGCRGRCTFCGVIPFMGPGVRAYPVERVIEEIAYLVTRRGVRHLEWLDDDLLANRDTIVEVLTRMIERRFPVTWAANNGLIAASLDEELVRLMIESGCVGFRIGIESGNDEMLRRIKKPASKASLRKASQLLATFPGLFVVGCYIIGFKGETFQQILDTFAFSLDMNLSWSGFSIFQVLRSADVHEEFDSEPIADFVPSKETADRTINPDRIRFAPTLEFPGEAIPSREELQELWFLFNLLANYLFNKHLNAGGSPAMFIRWVEALQMSYPSNAAMSLFLSLAYQLIEDAAAAREQRERTADILRDSDYWRQRFAQWGLDFLFDSAPRTAAQAQEALERLRDRYTPFLTGRGAGGRGP